MKFTAELPRIPGDYAWKKDLSYSGYILFQVHSSYCKLFVGQSTVQEIGGFWCWMVPADEVVSKEEVEKAWREGISWAVNISDNRADSEWTNSRARKVMEGKE